jgi:4-amino-4-deoxy-L-arabinose transferase-like glycosyltransferase
VNLSKKHHIALLVITCLSIFFVNLDALYINIMEARNFITAREMLHDGHWLLTTLNGEPRYQKPPLPTWLTAVSAAIFGLKNLFALRLPAALVSMLLVLVSYKFAYRVTKNKGYSFVAALILASSFYIVFAGRSGQWDIFTHAFMIVCIYQLYLFFTSEEKKYTRAMVAALFFGFSFMSKGPVSLYALLLPFLISFGAVYTFQSMRTRWLPLVLFAIVATVVSGWWYGYTYLFDAQSVLEITQREASNWTGYKVKPFYYYWSFFTQSGIWTIPAFISLLYPYLTEKVFDKKAYRFSWLWTIVSVVLLSLVPEKKSRYLLPVLIPLAFTTAFYIEYLFRRFNSLTSRWETFPVYFNFGTIALIGLLFPVVGYLLLQGQFEGAWVWFLLLSLALACLGFLIVKGLRAKNSEIVFYLTIVFIASIMCFGMPLAQALTVNPAYKPISQLHKWQERTQLKIYQLSGFSPEMVWDYGEPIPVLQQAGQMKIPPDQAFGVLVSEKNIPLFNKTFQEYSVEKVDHFDMSPKGLGNSSYKARLRRDLYLVKKR